MRLALILGCDPHHNRHSFEKQALQWERRTERRRQRPANKPGSRSRRTAKAPAGECKSPYHSTTGSSGRFRQVRQASGLGGRTFPKPRFRGTTTLVQLTGSMETADTEGSFEQGTYYYCVIRIHGGNRGIGAGSGRGGLRSGGAGWRSSVDYAVRSVPVAPRGV